VHFVVFVSVLPFSVQTIDQLQSPYKIFLRRAAPNSDGMVLVGEPINAIVDSWLQHVEGRAQHLYGFQQYFAYMFVDHRLCNFLMDQRKDKEVHGLPHIEIVSTTIPFQFL
jgi:hypothetical protein